jgi:hypothetical protein
LVFHKESACRNVPGPQKRFYKENNVSGNAPTLEMRFPTEKQAPAAAFQDPKNAFSHLSCKIVV